MVTLGKGICLFFGFVGSCYCLWLLWDCWRQTGSRATRTATSSSPSSHGHVNNRADWWCQLVFATVAFWFALALMTANGDELLSLVWQQDITPFRIAEKPAVASVSADLGVDIYFDSSRTGRSTIGIDCAHVPISDEQVAVLLQGAPELQWLVLAGTQITGGVLREMKHTPALHGLSLACSQIADGDLEHLGTLTQLRDLDLANTQITDDGLPYLHALANLRSLDLTDTEVTEGGVKTLRQVLPACRVVR